MNGSKPSEYVLNSQYEASIDSDIKSRFLASLVLPMASDRLSLSSLKISLVSRFLEYLRKTVYSRKGA